MKLPSAVLTFISLLGLQVGIAGTERSDTANTTWQNAREFLEAEAEFLSPEESKLQKLILKIRSQIENRGAVNLTTHIRFTRLLKDKTPTEIYMLERAIVLGTPAEQSRPEPVGDIEEIVIRWQPFENLPTDPEEFSIQDIRSMRGIRGIANQWYREGEYGLAYPVLLELGKRGFKDSQARLAYILFNGADGVKKSNLRAMGWLGASAHGRTEPRFKVLFKRFLRQVPEEYRPTVDRVVDAYQETFSHSDQLDCSTEHPYAEGIVKRVYCRFQLEAIADAQLGMRSWVDKVNSQDD